jgi:hypothetical protein
VAPKGVRVPIGVPEVEVRKVEGTEERMVVEIFAVFEAGAAIDANGSDEAVSRLEISLDVAVA